MPSIGLSSFLRGRKECSYEDTQKSVNALNRAFLISTMEPDSKFIRNSKSVNALNRAFLISTKAKTGKPLTKKEGCQCPQSGFPHFYGTPWETAIYKAFKTHFCK